jgi:Succinylglutamate desuccinylase / Aspartoacylase family
VGTFVAVAGNLGGLAQNRRFLHRDLNRAWTADRVAALRAQDMVQDNAEDREQRELLAVFEDCLARARGQVVFVDLHSSSADGASFTCIADTIPNRRLAMALPVPTILGLEECIDGATMEFFSEKGLVAVAVEGGQHQDPRTVDNLEAAVWLALVRVGLVGAGQVDVQGFRRTLRASAQGLPPVLEVRYRHVVTPERGFKMQPGYVSFQPVKKGELLAVEAGGELRALEDGRILLPLYQGQGEDGYFLCRSVRRLWLRVARILQAAGADRILPLLPGVRRIPGQPDALLVDPRVARFWPVEIFHLLGFRKRRRAGDLLRFSRRRMRPEAWDLGPRRGS